MQYITKTNSFNYGYLYLCVYKYIYYTIIHLRPLFGAWIVLSCIGCEQSLFHCFTLLHYCLTISLKWSDQFDLKYNNIPKSCVIWPITHASFISRKHMLQLDGPGLVIPKKGKICRVSNCNRNIRFLDGEGQHCWAFLKVSLNQFKYNIVFKLVLDNTVSGKCTKLDVIMKIISDPKILVFEVSECTAEVGADWFMHWIFAATSSRTNLALPCLAPWLWTKTSNYLKRRAIWFQVLNS